MMKTKGGGEQAELVMDKKSYTKNRYRPDWNVSCGHKQLMQSHYAPAGYYGFGYVAASAAFK